MNPSSEIYKISAGDYMRVLFPVYLRSRWYVFALVVLPFAVLSMVSLNFVYVCLMSLFLIVPMMLGYVYFYYALSEDCVSSIRKSRVSITKRGVLREYYDEEDKCIGGQETSWNDVLRVEIDGDKLLLFKKSGKFAFQVISSRAFANLSCFSAFVSEVERNIEANTGNA